jgi:hypothetical protein
VERKRKGAIERRERKRGELKEGTVSGGRVRVGGGRGGRSHVPESREIKERSRR